MDLEILQQLKRLLTLWNSKQQTGIIMLSNQQLLWINTDGTETDLTTLLQPITRTAPLNTIHTKQMKRLTECYNLGRQLDQNPDQHFNQSAAIRRTAQRVYDFYNFIGEQQLGRHPLITPSYLYRLTNTQFETLKCETLTNLITFGGPQAGVGDDLSSV